MNLDHLTPSSLGYFVFKSDKLAEWEFFLKDLVGLQLSDKSQADQLAFRMDKQEQRVLIEKGTANDLSAVGWEYDSDESLNEIVRHIEGSGVEIFQADQKLCDSRGVKKAYICTDPDGVNHELYYAASIIPMQSGFKSDALVGGFLAGRFGAGHYVANAENIETSLNFYRKVLCVRLSDFITGEVFPGGPVLEATFMHTKTGRHHSVACASIPIPKKLHHFMVEYEDMNDVGLAFDRFKAAGSRFFMGLGHHPNDQMFSFYVETPDGFGLEIGWGGVIIKEDNWEVKTYSQLSDWGHVDPDSTNK
ncbi:MAG: VOC family protein [Pseudomonadota bacterium]|nr:VOC family protein [Pseudomonadota bacterium]